MALAELDRDSLPVHYTREGDRQPCATIMTGHGREKNQTLFVFDGPEEGELTVPFDEVYYDDERNRLVLAKQVADRRTKVFGGEHWGQYGAVSEWFEANGVDEIPRRFK